MGTSTGGGAARLWQLISPTLPVGAYSYSQGLEQAVESRVVADEATAAEWIGGVLSHGLARTDLPLLLRVHAAWLGGDALGAVRWGRRLVAMRETAELRAEDTGMGAALARLLADLGTAMPAAELPFAAAFAIGAAEWGIAAHDAGEGYAWAWCEQQVAAAIKLVPLGHTAGQRLLLELGGRIGGAVDAAARLDDDALGMSLPGLALASALHETQYTRLFRS